MLGTPKVKGVSKEKKLALLIVNKRSMVNTLIMIKKRDFSAMELMGECSPQANLCQKTSPI
jgi:hypothetical protein